MSIEQDLFDAAKNGDTNTVKLLLDRGADIHARNDLALRWAAIGVHESVVELLKQYMSSPTIPNVEPKNNDGRNTCFWCGAPTRVFQMSFSTGNVCTSCER